MLESATGLCHHVGHVEADLVSEIHSLVDSLPDVLIRVKVIPLSGPSVDRCCVTILEHALHQTCDVIVCGCDIVENIVDEILLLNGMEGSGVVLLCPVPKAPNGQTPAVALLAHSADPVTLEFGDVIAGEFGRFRAEFHPEVEHVLGGRDVVETPADSLPGVVAVGSLRTEAFSDEEFDEFEVLICCVLDGGF